MQEIKRWLLNERVWLFVAVLLILLSYGYLKSECDDTDVSQTRKIWQITAEMLEGLADSDDPEGYIESLSEKYSQYELYSGSNEEKALENFEEIYQYSAEYSSYVAGVLKNAVSMQILSGLAEDGFTKRNLNREYADFEKVSGLTVQPCLAKGFISICQNEWLDYTLLAFEMILVLWYLHDRKTGFWILKRTAVSGRIGASVRFVFAGLVWTAVYVFLAEAVLGILAAFLYGNINLTLPVQYAVGYREVTYRISMAQYLIAVSLGKVLEGVTWLLVLWLVFISVKAELAAGIAVGLLFGIQRVMIKKVSFRSEMVGLRIFNICGLSHGDELLRLYKNINIGGIAVPAWICAALFMSTIAGLCLCSILICEQKQYPEHAAAFICVRKRLRKLVSLVNMKGKYLRLEGYKLFVCQGGYLAVMLLVVMLAMELDVTPVSYSEKESYRNQVLDELHGEYTPEKQAEFEKMKQDIEDDLRDVQLQKLDESGEGKNYEYLKYQEEILSVKKQVMEELSSFFEQLSEDSAQGRNVWILRDGGYAMLLTVSGYGQARRFSLYFLLFIVLLCSGSMAYERQKNMSSLVHACEKETHYQFRQKIMILAFWVFLADVAVCAVEFTGINIQIGMDGFRADIHSLEFLADCKAQMSILSFLVLCMLLRAALGLIVMTFILWISSRCQKISASIALCLLLFVLPAFLVVCGMRIIRYISVGELLCVPQWILNII